MPYITKDRRTKLNFMSAPENAGELNYCFTKLINDYWKANKCYQTANDIMGALAGAHTEFYRRCVADYENQKANSNGDVYD